MTIFGWDMSHFDSPAIGDAVGQGISFITHKAGGDTSSGDSELAAWWSGVKGLPQSVVLGAYWVLRPDLMKSAADEADNFIGRLDAVCKGWRDRDAFILQLDAEIWNGNGATKPSISECNAFCDRLKSRTSGAYDPVGYLPKWVYPDVSGFHYPIWASSYVSGSGGFKSLYPGDSSSRWNAYGKPISILQYTSSATIGGQTTCDANAYRGTVVQLKQLITPGGSDMEVSDLVTALNDSSDKTGLQKAFINGVLRSWFEEDPQSTADPKGQGRIGGWIRMMEQRASGRFNALMAAITSAEDAETQTIIAGVLAGLDPGAIAAAVAAALPADQAKQVADELAARLAS